MTCTGTESHRFTSSNKQACRKIFRPLRDGDSESEKFSTHIMCLTARRSVQSGPIIRNIKVVAGLDDEKNYEGEGKMPGVRITKLRMLIFYET